MASASWIVGNDVATICTSRIAMNMPTHMAAKPIHVRTVTHVVRPRSMARPGPTIGEWLVNGWSMAGDIPHPRQCPILRADANPQDREVGDREDQCIPRQAKAERQDSDLADDDKIIRV